jgi:hypothetical protein
MASTKVRIFPHSREEFPTEDLLRMWLLNGLRGRGGVYLLRSADAVADLPAGSIVLFRYGQVIVGEAVVSKGKKKEKVTEKTLSGQEEVEYAAHITFAPSSIRLYSPPLPVTHIQQCVREHKMEKDISSAQPYYELDWDIYACILEKVVQESVFFS